MGGRQKTTLFMGVGGMKERQEKKEEKGKERRKYKKGKKKR
jgi:hypothetical protein